MKGQPESETHTGIGKRVVDVAPKAEPQRKVIDASRHIYEVDGKWVCEQPIPLAKKTPAQEFYELFAKNGSLYP